MCAPRARATARVGLGPLGEDGQHYKFVTATHGRRKERPGSILLLKSAPGIPYGRKLLSVPTNCWPSLSPGDGQLASCSPLLMPSRRNRSRSSANPRLPKGGGAALSRRHRRQRSIDCSEWTLAALRRDRALDRPDPHAERLRPAQHIDRDRAVDLVG